jgi:hypothetical protein
VGAVRRIPWRLWLIALAGACWLVADRAGVRDVDQSSVYLYATSLLLAIGLYGSTYGIDLGDARAHGKLIVMAVTVGVLFKAALIGGVLFAATRDPLFLLLGVAVAQIDPLSVAAIIGDRRMSGRTKTVLAAWASFDDPLTVILVVYASAFVAGPLGVGHATATGSGATAGLLAYAVTLAANLAFAALAYAAWYLLRRGPRWVLAVVFALLAVVAVWQFLMLGVAIVGLFLRPAWLADVVGRVTQVALFVAAGLLGLLLVDGVDLRNGVLLGVMAFVAQMVAGWALTRGMPRIDRVHLALAQQNGITAIILALRLEAEFSGVVAVVAPGIVVTNTIHFAANWLVDRRRGPAARAGAAGDVGSPEPSRAEPGPG